MTLYNGCFGGSTNVSENDRKSKSLLSFSAGASLTQLKYGSVPSGAPTGDYSTGWKPMASINLEIMPSKLSKPWSTYLELMYSSVGFEAVSPYQGRPYFFDLSYLRVNTSFRYYLGTPRINPFIQAGLGVGYAIKSDFFAGLPVDQRFQPRKIGNAFHLTGGSKFNERLSIAIRYEYNLGFSTEKFPSHFTTLAAVVSYQVTKRGATK